MKKALKILTVCAFSMSTLWLVKSHLPSESFYSYSLGEIILIPDKDLPDRH